MACFPVNDLIHCFSCNSLVYYYHGRLSVYLFRADEFAASKINAGKKKPIKTTEMLKEIFKIKQIYWGKKGIKRKQSLILCNYPFGSSDDHMGFEDKLAQFLQASSGVLILPSAPALASWHGNSLP